ncbi:MAG TPA: ABC transporter ATP-binding protein [Burkholderiales bacterium]|nr:ABC transporter ATP-binding protein [Burkholderiales bacterium]
MLEVDSLAFGFAGRVVGQGIGFTLAAGEVMCVLGPNGGGKTTLFRTLLGLLPPLGGTVRVQGAPLEALTRTEIARRVGYVPQAHVGTFAFTVREMVLMGRTAHLGAFASPAARDREVAERAIASLGIEHLAHRPFTEISGGERQLALVARALAQDPVLLVMDEPTASLDFGNQLRVLDRIGELARRGIAVLFSTHDPDHAFLCAQRALLLAEGRALEVGAPREVIRPETLRRMYGVAVRIVDAGNGQHACLPEPAPR